MNDFTLFIPITKVDEEKRMVYGTVTEEVQDKSGEVFHYDSSKPFFEAWSAAISEATGGKSVGNLRAMHTNKVAGKLTELTFDDAEKRISCAAKVLADDEWSLVMEGAYTGFSQGGKYVRRWTDDDGLKRYTANPAEVSIVDNPCLGTAHFQMVKADGSVEQRAFLNTEDTDMGERTADATDATDAAYAPTNDEVKSEAAEMAKAAGKTGRDAYKDYVAKARDGLIAKHAGTVVVDLDKGETVVIPGGAAGTGGAGGYTKKEVAEIKPGDVLTGEIGKAVVADEGQNVTIEVDPIEAEIRRQAPDLDFEGVATALTKAAEWPTEGSPADEIATWALSETTRPVVDPADALTAALDKAAAAVQPVETAAMEAARVWTTEALEDTAKGLDEVGKAYEGHPLAKGLRGIASLSYAIYQLVAVQAECAREAAEEGDGSGVPGTIAEGIRTLGSALVAMAQEEVAELISDIAEAGMEEEVFDPEVFCYGAKLVDLVKADTALMEKAGARNSKSDQTKIQSMHDNAVSLGATCTTEKAVAAEDLAKVTADRDRLADVITKAVPRIETLEAEIMKLKAQPMPPKTAASTLATVVAKETDAAGAEPVTAETITAEQFQKALDALPADQRGELLLRVALKQPRLIGNLPQRAA